MRHAVSSTYNAANQLTEADGVTYAYDRFLHHGHVISLDGESYRLREARNVITPA